jgi:F-type H+-transporting ATPase subunit gamma
VAKAKAIVKRRKSVINTRKITKTMELVSTAKFKQAFNRVTNAMPYRRTLQEVMSDLAAAGGDVQHPLLERREPAKHVTVLLVTSSRGLAGGFNSNLVRLARAYVEEQRAAGAEVALYVAGKKGITGLRTSGIPLAGELMQFGDRVLYDDVEKLANQFIAAYESAKTDRVVVVSQKYVSAAVQRPNAQVLLPLETAAVEAGKKVQRVEYLYSPDAPSILKSLLPAYFRTALYHAFLENAVGEQRARMVAMKNATDNAEGMIKALTRAYNRARQSQITNEIAELMGGVEALK